MLGFLAKWHLGSTGFPPGYSPGIMFNTSSHFQNRTNKLSHYFTFIKVLGFGKTKGDRDLRLYEENKVEQFMFLM